MLMSFFRAERRTMVRHLAAFLSFSDPFAVAIDIIVQHIDDVLKEHAGPRKAVVDPVAMLARVGGSVKQLEYAEISQ